MHRFRGIYPPTFTPPLLYYHLLILFNVFIRSCACVLLPLVSEEQKWHWLVCFILKTEIICKKITGPKRGVAFWHTNFVSLLWTPKRRTDTINERDRVSSSFTLTWTEQRGNRMELDLFQQHLGLKELNIKLQLVININIACRIR